jgi:hypothetical protein
MSSSPNDEVSGDEGGGMSVGTSDHTGEETEPAASSAFSGDAPADLALSPSDEAVPQAGEEGEPASSPVVTAERVRDQHNDATC